MDNYSILKHYQHQGMMMQAQLLDPIGKDYESLVKEHRIDL